MNQLSKMPAKSRWMVRISELLPNPIGDDTLYEFIELKNYSNYSILLCGVSIDTGDHTTKFLLDDYILSPQAFLSLERPRTRVTLGNEKGKVRLVSSLSGNLKVLDEVIYDQSQEGWSYARTDTEWWTWTKSPTLGAKNRFDTGVIASRFHSDGVILSSLLPNAPASDSTSEWIELKNTNSEYRSLVGWKLFETKMKKTVSLDNFSIVPGSTLRLWSSETKLQLPNAGGKIELLNPYDTVISTIEWPEAKEGSIYHASEFFSDTLSAKAAKVLDGDTFIASFDEVFEKKFGFREISIRLIGIDAPEIAHDGKKAHEYSFEAKENLRALIEGKNIELEFGSEKYDAYGRLLAYVHTDTSQIVQLLILKSGLAQATKEFPHLKQEEFLSFETMAKEKEFGTWSSKPYALSGALITAKIPENQSSLSISGAILSNLKNEYRNQKIVITEVYASPKTALQASIQSFATLEIPHDMLSSLRWEGKEWIEVKNLSDTSLNLKGWILRAGTGANLRERVIEQDILILPRSYALLDISDFHLQLRNDGALLELLDPESVVRNAVVYPKLSKGQSYSRRSPAGKSFCITESPTPLKDTRCTGKVKKKRRGK